MSDQPREHGLLFKAEMVRAILAGAKIQTRRPLTPRRATFGSAPRLFWEHGDFEGAWVDRSDPRYHVLKVPCHEQAGCAVCREYGWQGTVHRLYPVVQPGERFWVRETWRSWETTCEHDHFDEDHEHPGPHCRQVYVAYAATPREGFRPVPDRARITYLHPTTPLETRPELLGPWKSPIHLPRQYARIVLPVTAVHIERLDDITEEDARAEGFRELDDPGAGNQAWARDRYRLAYRQMYGLPPDVNPLALAYSFEREKGGARG